MKFLPSASPSGAFSVTITLYQVTAPAPTATPSVSNGVSFTVSPVGVGEDGKTTYVEEGVLTEVVAVFSDFTSTITPTPVTSTYTVEEGATGVLVQMSLIDSVFTQLGDKFIYSCKFLLALLRQQHSHIIELCSLLMEGTIEEDVSGLVGQASVNDPRVSPHPEDQIIQSCNFQGNTAGSCVQAQDLVGMSLTASYSGALIPVYTLTETASIPGQTQNSGALT